MINMVGRLPISGIASRRHAPTERVAIYSSGAVMSHATVRRVSTPHTDNICSSNFTLR